MIKSISIAIVLLTHFVFATINATEVADTAKVYVVPSITVTTTRAVEGISSVPFTEVQSAEIEKKYYLQDIPILLNDLPSIFAYSQNGNGVGYSNLSLRGFDQRRIAVYINGVPQNDPEDHQVYWIDFPDIASNLDNIQVQRGAGLSNYGASAIGGSINLSTLNFITQKGVRIYTGLGFQEYNYPDKNVLSANTNKLSVEISSGLVDNYAVYARLSQINSAGYRDRSWANLSSYFLSAVRFDENLTTQLNIFGGPITDGLAYVGIPKSYIKDKNLRRINPSAWAYDSTGKNLDYLIERRKQEIEEFSQPHFEILNDWTISDNLSLKSVLFYYIGDGFFDYDASWADTSMLRISSEYGFNPTENPLNAIVRANVSNKQGGWIPRIIWNNPLGEFMGGAEIRLHRSEHWGKINYAEYLPQNYDPDYKFYSYNGYRDIFSLFARQRFMFEDKLILNAEAQVVYHKYKIYNEKKGNKYMEYRDINNKIITNGEDLFSITYCFVNPRIGATYNWDESLNFYTQIALTHREPRMRNLYPASDSYFGGAPLFEGTTEGGITKYDFTKPLIKPEKMLNLELGSNYNFKRGKINVNLYWMEYFDEFVKSGRLDIFGNPIDGNAPRSRHYGIELQMNTNILSFGESNLNFSFNTTLSQNKIIEYDFITDQKKKISLANNDIAGFPNVMGNIRLSFENQNFYCALSGKYVGKSRTDNFGDLIKTNADLIEHLRNEWDGYYEDNILDDFFILNLNLSYRITNIAFMNSVTFNLFVNNLLNRLYAAGAEGKEFFPGAERSFFIGLELAF